MQRVTGIGGIFFKAQDPEKLTAWYVKHLGLPTEEDGASVVLRWGEGATVPAARKGGTIFAPFAADTTYFEPSRASFMINFRVADLHALLTALRAEGVTVVGEVEEMEYGRFGWCLDPEGNKIELWEPAAGW